MQKEAGEQSHPPASTESFTSKDRLMSNSIPYPVRDATPPIVSIHEKRAAYVVMTNVEVTRTILGTLGTTAYGIYALLDTYCNDAGIAWPSIATIVEQTMVSESTVHRTLGKLEADGWITREDRKNRFGFTIGKLYTLPYHATPSGERGVIPPVIGGVKPPVTDTPVVTPKVNTKVNQEVNPKKGDTPLNPPKPRKGPTDYSASFEDWWVLFPRKEDKAKAFAAWKRLDPDAALIARIMERTARYADCQKVADGYVQLPTTFLNGRRWEDEMVPAGQRPAPAPTLSFRGKDIGLSNDDLLAIAKGERP